MGRDEGKAVIRPHLKIDFDKATTHAEPPAKKQKGIIGMRVPSHDRELAENRQMDVGVRAGDVLPKGVVQALGSQGLAQLEKGVRVAHFLQREHLRLGHPEALANLRLPRRRLGGAGAEGPLEVILQVVSGHPENARRPRAGRSEQGRQTEQDRERTRNSYHGCLILVEPCQVQRRGRRTRRAPPPKLPGRHRGERPIAAHTSSGPWPSCGKIFTGR